MKNNFSGFTSLENSISKIIKPLSKRKKDNFVMLNALRQNWLNIVGDKYQQYCFPEKIKINKENKATLFIVVYNSAFAFAIDGNQNQIIEKIACYFGYKAIHNIKITQEIKEINIVSAKITKPLAPEQEKFISDNVKNIKNADLKDILAKLGSEVL